MASLAGEPQAELRRFLASRLHGHHAPAVLLAAVGQARGQGALARAADAGQEQHGLLTSL